MQAFVLLAVCVKHVHRPGEIGPLNCKVASRPDGVTVKIIGAEPDGAVLTANAEGVKPAAGQRMFSVIEEKP